METEHTPTTDSAEWLDDCADCMEEEGLDRENNARHFRSAARAIRNNHALVEALNAAKSVLSSINSGKFHAVKRNDGEVVFGQTGEWCEWAKKEVLPMVEKALKLAGAE